MKPASLVVALVLVGCGGSGSGGSGGGGGSGSGGGGAATCSASNCTGCCFNSVCQAGNTAAGCGKGGGDCFACINGGICKTDQTCGIDPASMWKVQPDSATITTTNMGASWDFGGGAPDPYINLFCPAGAAVVTAVAPSVADSFMPTWTTTTGSCVMTASQLIATGFGMGIYDLDVTTYDTISSVGTVKVTEGHLAQGFISFNAFGNITALKINLVKQ